MSAQAQKFQGQQSQGMQKSSEFDQKSEFRQQDDSCKSKQCEFGQKNETQFGQQNEDLKFGQQNMGQRDFGMQNGGLKSPQPTGEVQQGLVNRMKQSFESPRSGSPTNNLQSSFEVEQKDTGAECIMQEAQCLKMEAKRVFETSEEEFRRAQAAQEEAARASELANQITIQALNKEVEGQEKLVQAGHKLMEAGAKLQAEAAIIGRDRQAVINIHQKGQVRQEVQVETPIVPPPSELHVLQSRNVTQCIPVQTTEEREYVAQYQSGPQIGF